MINISKSGNAIKFEFTDSDHYLYGDGVVETPVNSLSLVIDESKFVTFKKAATNDSFISFDPANSNLSDKAGVIEFFKTSMVGSNGGSESGITSGEVQTMIDESISGKADTTLVNQIANEAEQAILSISGDVQTKLSTSNFNAYSAATATAIDGKQDALQFYGEDTEQWEEEDGDNPDSTAVFTQKHSDIYMEDSGDEGSSQAGVQTRVDTVKFNGVLDTGHSGSLVNIYANESSNETTEYGSSIEVSDNGVGIKASFIDYDDESSQRLASINMNHNDVSISLESTANEDSTVMVINTSGVTINDERVLTEADGTYFIDLDAIMSRGGLTDADWDGAIAAVNAHRPVYIKFYNDHYILESYSLDNNTMYLSASDGIAASRFTITKNGSNDYTLNRAIRGFVTDAEKTAWNAKVDTSAITTAITSGSTDSEIPTAKAVYDATQSGGGGSVTVDPTLDSGSTNPVANSAITNAINAKQDKLLNYTYIVTDVKRQDSTGKAFLFEKKNIPNGSTFNSQINMARINGNGIVSVTTDFQLVETSAITTSLTSSSTDAQVPSAKAVYDTLGGLKLVSLTQSEYSAMEQAGTLDANTLYIVSNVVS